jgi:uncharacterized protein with PIN domain
VIRAERLDDQLIEVAHRWPIFRWGCPLSRCATCGVLLEPAAGDEARSYVPDYVARTQTTFQRCPHCGRFFWRATHTEKILERLQSVADRAGQTIPSLAKPKAEGAKSDSADPAPP